MVFSPETNARRFSRGGLLKLSVMNGKSFWLTIIAVIVSFAGGFLLANAFNRTELNALQVENARLKTVQPDNSQNQSNVQLSEEEIRQRIGEADANPNNFGFQKNLGLALYRYAAMKQDPELLSEVGRLLNRAFENDKKDYDVLITLGNIYFDVGYFKKDNAQFQKARELYQLALQQKPNDADARTDLGLTYFLTDPPENARAIAEFQKSLQTNPKHEKTLQVLAQTFLSENNYAEAEKYLAKLKEVNANNQYLPELEARVSQIKNGS